MVSRVALGITLGVLWAASFLVMGILHSIFPAYAAPFFALMGSIYPGISGSGTVTGIAVGVLYGAADGFFFGFVMAWIYNVAAARFPK